MLRPEVVAYGWIRGYEAKHDALIEDFGRFNGRTSVREWVSITHVLTAYAGIASGLATSLVRAGVGGTISMSGGFTHFAGGSVAIEMGGTAAGQFGRITINGPAHSTPLRAPAAVLPSTGDGDHF